MGNEKGKGWLQFELNSETEIERIVWGRDRLGKFGDRLAQVYKIEYTDYSGKWQLLTESGSRHDFDNKQVKRDPFHRDQINSDQNPKIDRLLKDRSAAIKNLSILVSGNRAIFSGLFKEAEPQFLPPQRRSRTTSARGATRRVRIFVR